MGLSLISHVSLLVSLFTAFTKLQDQNTVTVIPTRGHLECTVKKISQKGPSAVPWAPFCLACRRPLTVPISEYFRRPSNGWSRLPNGFELTYFGCVGCVSQDDRGSIRGGELTRAARPRASDSLRDSHRALVNFRLSSCARRNRKAGRSSNWQKDSGPSERWMADVRAGQRNQEKTLIRNPRTRGACVCAYAFGRCESRVGSHLHGIDPSAAASLRGDRITPRWPCGSPEVVSGNATVRLSGGDELPPPYQ